MNLLNKTISAAAALVVAGLAGCEGRPLNGPPQLRLGRDECRECGMIINEDRCSSALLLDRDGRREHALFDDLGCMLDSERDGLDGAAVVGRYVHDYTTRQWGDAAQATFLLASPAKLSTPMSSGMVAHVSRSDAEQAQAKFGGELLDYQGAAAARKLWLNKRRAATSQPDP